MTDKPKRIIFTASDLEREMLEHHRVRLGLRSHAETLRALIRSNINAQPAPRYPVYETFGRADKEGGAAPRRIMEPQPELKMPKAAPGSRLKKR